MTKEIKGYSITFTGDSAESNPTEAQINYVVCDTGDSNLEKSGAIIVTENPENVTWSSAKSSINTEEGIS